MRITRVLTSKGLTGYYSDDKAAIIRGAKMDVFHYLGEPVTPGFKTIRMPGESVSIILILDNGEHVFGDCCSSQYSGSGGRTEPFTAAKYIPIIEDKIVKSIEGYAFSNFKDMRELIEEINEETSIHPSILFGLTQAFLAAAAKKKQLTMTEVICEEYQLPLPSTRVPIHVQTGDNRYLGVDKAIIKKADAFPQGLINTIDKIGENGETLLKYAKWIVKRIRKFGEPGFDPYIHFDTYGMIGRIFKQDLVKVTKYILKLEEILKPYRFQLEMPIDSENKQKQIESLNNLNKFVKDEGSNVILIADEWANKLDDIKDWADSKAADMIHIKPTDVGSLFDIIDSVIYCKEKNVHAYLGGSCNETDRAAQITAQIALALRPFQISAKPGMDIDEGIMTVYNEMERTLKLINYRRQMSD